MRKLTKMEKQQVYNLKCYDYLTMLLSQGEKKNASYKEKVEPNEKNVQNRDS